MSLEPYFTKYGANKFDSFFQRAFLFLRIESLTCASQVRLSSEQETFPVIIASHLNDGEEEDLKAILRKHREAIVWTMTDIKGLSPTIVQHRIHLNEDATPKRDPQRRLNPIMQEAVHTEIVKLLDNGIIYPISDSQWVSPVHAVPKKFGFTIVENGPNSTSHENLSLH